MKTFMLYLTMICTLLACGSKTGTKTSNRNLSNTTWKYSDNVKSYEITFKSNGYIRSTNKADVTPKNDRWKQNGDNVKFSFNDQYAIYTGKFVNDDLITGSTVNKVGKTWKWKLIRK